MGLPVAKSGPTGNQPRRFHVDASGANTALGTLLRQSLKITWGQARQLIATRRVQVNGNLCVDPGRRLAPGDVVHVFPHSLAQPPREVDVKIRHIDEHLVVVEKPSGMTTLRHPEERFWPAARRQRQPTLEECLNRIIAKRHRGRNAHKGRIPRVRPVHRLDRDTSGVMVFARNVKAERGLIHQFAKHTITRRYLAVVVGQIAAQTIESVLIRDRGDGRRGSAPPSQAERGKRAVTHVRPVEQLDGFSLVECKLETGRTHQIRIHLSDRGHPVCGDKVYSAKKFAKSKTDDANPPRLALHACELNFIHPITGKHMAFESPLPSDLRAFVSRLRRPTRSSDA
jgi:23S rRNA pseudouridine1911/1915/1917 synthase